MTAQSFPAFGPPVYLGALTDTSPAAAGVAHGADTLSGCAGWDMLTFILEGLGATGGALVVRVQDQPNVTLATFYDLAAFNSIAAAAAAADSIQRMHTSLTGVPNKIGSADAPKLVAGTIAGGLWGDVIRLSYEALAGTSAGAVQTVRVFGSKVR